MKKIKLVVSDLHLGRGSRLHNGMANPFEDFHWDFKFKEFLDFYTSGPHEDSEIELIFNGDILNLILTDYHGQYTITLTEQISLEKLRTIIRGHPIFFSSLKEFLKNSKHSLTYVIGNHDQEMMWESARRLFELSVGAEVQWKTTYYEVDGIHIEHGHQYEAANRIDPAHHFSLEDPNEPILNLPWGTLFAVQLVTKFKLKRPMIDKIRPIKHMILWMLWNDTFFAMTCMFKVLAYFLSSRFSRHRKRHGSLKTSWHILKQATALTGVEEAASQILQVAEIHTVIFGHTHVYKHLQYGENKQYLNTGTWTETLSLDLSAFGKITKLTYVRVDYEGDRPIPVLRHWIGQARLEEEAVAC